MSSKRLLVYGALALGGYLLYRQFSGGHSSPANSGRSQARTATSPERPQYNPANPLSPPNKSGSRAIEDLRNIGNTGVSIYNKVSSYGNRFGDFGTGFHA